MTSYQRELAAWSGVLLVLILIALGVRLDLGIARWTLIATAGALGFAIGWTGTPDARPVRVILKYLLLALVMLQILLVNSTASWNLSYILAAGAFLMGLAYWAGRAVRGFFTKPTTFGSAEWASHEYLAENGLLGEGGIYLGTYPGPNGPERLRYTGDRHILTIAPTRAGKGTTAIIPNLLGGHPRQSVMVIDPKGENSLITAEARRKMGQEVHVVDPWSIAEDAYDQSSCFNPLDWLVPGDLDQVENAMLLADALVVPDGNGDQFWTEEAKALLQGLILYVATDEHETDDRHLGRVRDLLLLDGEDMPQLFQRMAASPHHIVASTGARCIQKEEKLLANVIASAQAQTHFLDSQRVRSSLASSDFRFEDLKAKPMTIYLVLPADRLHTFGRWLRLLVQQSITVCARAIASKPEKPVIFLLDEMPSLGRLTVVEQAMSLMAGFGLMVWIIAQDYGRITHLYGKSASSFVANCGAIQYFGSRDPESADLFSALCGQTTVWSLSHAIGQTFTRSKDGGSSSSSTTDTSSMAQRKLAFPDELMRMSPRQLVLIENHHPIIANKTPWFEDERLKGLGRNLMDQPSVMELPDGGATDETLLVVEGTEASKAA